MQKRSVIEWYKVVETTSSDLVTARLFFANLVAYTGKPYRSDLEQLVHLMAAVRMHQLAVTPMPDALQRAPVRDGDEE